MAPKNTRSILFVGNSYTGRNNLPELLTCLAASVADPISLKTQAILANGMPLRAHWNKGDVVRALEDRTWDWVALQEQSTMPLKNPGRMRESVELLDREIRQRQARTALYMTWARKDSPEKQRELSEVYRTLGQEYGAVVIPVGESWSRILVRHPEIALYEADGSHPTLAGSYLAACVFLNSLLDRNPIGAWIPEKGLDPDLAGVLQRTAGELSAV